MEGYLQAVILGFIEGITEYLPISSTFHLIWASKLLGIPQTEFQKAFEVIIQGGAILAVVLLYFRTFLTDKKLFFKVCVSFFPTATLAFLLYRIIKGVLFTSFTEQLVIFGLVGIFFIFFESFKKQGSAEKNLTEISYKDAIIIGLVQVLAVFPGVSRAGAVIVGMMMLGYKKTDAAKYSFLLAVPTLLAASALDLYKSLPFLLTNMNLSQSLIIGFVASFVSALIVVKWFLGYLKNHSLVLFGYYRILAALLLFLIFR